jgi:competence protein ComFC
MMECRKDGDDLDSSSNSIHQVTPRYAEKNTTSQLILIKNFWRSRNLFLKRFLAAGGKIVGNILCLAIYNVTCKGCGVYLVLADEDLLCRDCREKIARVREYDRWRSKCTHCGRFLDHRYPLCGSCTLQPPLYRKHVSYSSYHDLLRELVLMYKYGGMERLKYLFADYYLELYKAEIDEPFDYIVPVPQDRGRKREFVPVLEIVKTLSRRLGIPPLTRHLLKVKKTLPQVGLTRAQRIKNLDGAFRLKHPQKIAGKKLLLIDDVYTTGTTIRQCVQLLVSQEADVVVLTLARS